MSFITDGDYDPSEVPVYGKMDKWQREKYIITNVSIFITVLDHAKDVRDSCAICPLVGRKLEDRGEICLTFDRAGSTCKKCLTQIARRKIAFLATREFLLSGRAKYFRADAIHRFMKDTLNYKYADFVRPYVPIVLVELASRGAIDIYTKKKTGNIYRINDITIGMLDDVASSVTGKRYGYAYGYKKIAQDGET